MTYVCVCGSKLSCVESLNTHVIGSSSPAKKRNICSSIKDLAKKVASAGTPLHEDKAKDLPLNAWPTDFDTQSSTDDEETCTQMLLYSEPNPSSTTATVVNNESQLSQVDINEAMRLATQQLDKLREDLKKGKDECLALK
ncbi:hypothetical protein BGX27_004046, partial [Mortierella sp. AM989]